MPLLSRKGVLAIAAGIDVTINASGRRVSAKALAVCHKLPPHHLEPVLQHGVHELGPGAATHQRRRYPAFRQPAEDAEEPPLPVANTMIDVVLSALAEGLSWRFARP
jgi:hypothetical protein